MKPYDEASCQKIISFWKGAGLSDFAICGWLSNWLIESGFRSDNAQNSKMNAWGITDEEYVQRVDDGTWISPDEKHADFAHDGCGMGLVQWTSSGRKQGLWDYVRKNSKSIADFQSQLDYAYIEYTSPSYKKTKEGLEAAQSAYDAAIVIMTTFEKPASMNDPVKQKERGDLAEEFYQKYFAGDQPQPQPKHIILALSAGHYLYRSGKRCDKSLDPDETREWVLNARVADMLTNLLSKYDGIEIVRLDDPTGETPTSLEERAKRSDAHHADFYLAIHHNAAKELFNGGGVVVYHYPTDKNKAQATALYNDVVSANGLVGNRSIPIVATTDLYEVAAPAADSILLENGFMNSTVDTPIILTPEFAQKTAQGLCKFFVDYFGLKLKENGNANDLIQEIKSIRNNIRALEVNLDQKLMELEEVINGNNG